MKIKTSNNNNNTMLNNFYDDIFESYKYTDLTMLWRSIIAAFNVLKMSFWLDA